MQAIPSSSSASYSQPRGFPKVELLRSPTVVLLRAALPGVRDGDFEIRVEESDLVIEGELTKFLDDGVQHYKKAGND